MNEADRVMSLAEREASRGYMSPVASRLSTGSSSTMSEDLEPIPMNQIQTSATIAAARTHPIEQHRTQTHLMQQLGTVGAGDLTKKDEKPLPNFGAGKPYPQMLPAQEEYVVEYDGKDDPMHPQNWPLTKKLYISAICAFVCFCSTFSSSIFAAAVPGAAADFGSSQEVTILGVSLFILGYAFGPLVWAPMSELFGRRIPMILSMFLFVCFSWAAATAENIQTMCITRFFIGTMGSSPLSIVAAIFADMYSNETRGVAIVIYASTVFCGPMCTDFVGGFIILNPHLNWRWVLYVPAFLGSGGFVLLLLFLKETYAPVILVNKAAELRRRTKNWGIHAKQEEIEIDMKELVSKNFSRPLRMLFTEPVIFAVTLYMSFVYSLLYCFLTAYPVVFEGIYHFNQGEAGLPLIACIIGLFLSCLFTIWDSSRYNKKLRANNGIPVAEWRLLPAMVGGVTFTGAIFWFGWTSYTGRISYWAPTISGIGFGFGILSIFICLFNYIIDSYLMFAASAIAANSFLRSIMAASFPLFSRQMFDNLGVEWASTLLGCIAALLMPIPFLFYKFGYRLRAKSKMAPTGPPPKKVSDEEKDSSDYDEHHDDPRMSALHAARSRADHDTTRPVKTRTDTSGASGVTGFMSHISNGLRTRTRGMSSATQANTAANANPANFQTLEKERTEG